MGHRNIRRARRHREAQRLALLDLPHQDLEQSRAVAEREAPAALEDAEPASALEE